MSLRQLSAEELRNLRYRMCAILVTPQLLAELVEHGRLNPSVRIRAVNTWDDTVEYGQHREEVLVVTLSTMTVLDEADPLPAPAA